MLGMISCKEATLLVQKKEERKLSFGETVKLRIHNMLCGICSLFEKQSNYIAHHAGRLTEETPGDAKMSDAGRDSLKQRLKEK